ncbi:hypothetical protein AMECASPLE_016489 [Ameca splendens]|uniref:Uncharacterized protein n=1 Tax=Ameca splendens TaxID=208324 RepID=A0ABV0YE52_9TELE
MLSCRAQDIATCPNDGARFSKNLFLFSYSRQKNNYTNININHLANVDYHTALFCLYLLDVLCLMLCSVFRDFLGKAEITSFQRNNEKENDASSCDFSKCVAMGNTRSIY